MQIREELHSLYAYTGRAEENSLILHINSTIETTITLAIRDLLAFYLWVGKPVSNALGCARYHLGVPGET